MKKYYHTNYELLSAIKRLFLFVTISVFSAFQGNSQTYATVPFTDGFETGTLGPSWTTFSSIATGGNSVIQTGTLTWSTQTANSNSGNYFLGMHYPTGGSFNTNQCNLHLNLAGESGLRLSFWWAEWNDESQVEDGVFISDDNGTNFVKVLDLPGASYPDLVYTHFDMSLDSINAVHGLTFSSQYIVRFQQYDNFYFAGGNDGHLYDDVSVYNVCGTSSSIAENTCSSYTTPSGNQTYTTSGIYSDTIPNAAGCDSIISIDLQILQPTSDSIVEIACVSYNAPDGMTYTTSGMYTAIVPNAAGCDSTITIDLTINPISSTNITESTCSDYTAPDGAVYTTSGTYTADLLSSSGCDSTVVIDLTVNTATSSTITESVLDTYTVPSGDETYTISGTYSDTIPNSNGCDSVIIINLTVEYTGLDELSSNILSIYPNPTSGSVKIDGLEELMEIQPIEVFDNKGRLVMKLELESDMINFDRLEPGAYLILVRHNKGNERLSVVKTN